MENDSWATADKLYFRDCMPISAAELSPILSEISVILQKSCHGDRRLPEPQPGLSSQTEIPAIFL